LDETLSRNVLSLPMNDSTNLSNDRAIRWQVESLENGTPINSLNTAKNGRDVAAIGKHMDRRAERSGDGFRRHDNGRTESADDRGHGPARGKSRIEAFLDEPDVRLAAQHAQRGADRHGRRIADNQVGGVIANDAPKVAQRSWHAQQVVDDDLGPKPSRTAMPGVVVDYVVEVGKMHVVNAINNITS
jgi:hypothetical protein